MNRALPAGLYAITDPELLPEPVILERVTQAIAGGATTIQFRDKASDAATRSRIATALVRVCRAAGAVLIINDDPELAAGVGAHGVHVGRDDEALGRARAIVGSGALVGVSCYDSLDLAMAAAQAGADYVAFGSVFPSTVKPGAVRAPLSLVSEAARRLDVPVVAIGGISRHNAASVINAGAHAVAVITDLFGDPDPRAAARAIVTACERGRAPLE